MIHHPALTEKLIYQMYIVEDMTIPQIADEMGVSKRTINNYVKKFGLLKRDKQEILQEAKK